MLRLLRNSKFRRRALESVFLIGLAAAVISAVLSVRASTASLGMTAGFGFLERTTGFDIGFSLIEFSGMDSYGRLLAAGLANTVFLGLIGILCANIVGLMVALMRLSDNGVLNLIGTTYIETFRNVPLILQVLFWYAILTHLPAPRGAEPLWGGIFLTSRGLSMPGLNVAPWALLGWALTLIGLVILAVKLPRRRARTKHSHDRRLFLPLAIAGAAALMILIGWAARLPDTPLIDMPALRGLNIRGGIHLAPELTAMICAIAIYGGAYIAEILRAGFNSVSRGQVEAGRALGLSKWDLFTRIRMPLAIRAVLPTLTNQYVWLMKATTLGVAVGFADFFSVISVSINQSGQTLELIALLMLGFLVINNLISLIMNRINNAIKIRGTQQRG